MAKRSIREAVTASVEGEREDGGPSERYLQYTEAIAAYEREFKKWEGRVERILKRYRDENRDKTTAAQSRFNILWSNVQTLVPATYSRLPQPDVSRRFRDNDPVGRVAALILERALEFEIQHYRDYRETMRQSVHDRFLGGRGTSWTRYEPHFKPSEQVTEDVHSEEQNEALDYECTPTDYVHWRDFGHSVARTWEEVSLVWRKVYMGKEAVEERFGEEIANSLPYDASPDDLKRSARTAQDNWKSQAVIYELWDKDEKKAVWLTKSKKEFLDEKDDPLGLQEFFPCPKPLFATLTNETLVPIPDFTLYQDQANELDVLADRIDGLTKMLQLKGVYDGSADASLSRLFTEGENGTLVPVKNWAAFAEKGGLKGQVDVYDLTPLVQALKTAQEGMEQVKNQVYEITGISDIVRGETQASETATAQQIKGQYASLRLKAMQEAVALYATEILQLKAQVICSKYRPETIKAIAATDQLTPEDQQFIDPALALLIGPERMQNPEAESPNPMRSFRIEIAADSLVQLDESQEKQDRMEMLTAFGQYLEKSAQVGAVAPQLVPLIIEVGKFAITSFKVGKGIEGTFDNALDQLKQLAANPPPKPPDPAIVKAEAEIKANGEKHQQDLQFEQQKHADDMQFQREKHGAEMRRHQDEHAMKLQSAEFERGEQARQFDSKLAMDKETRMADIEARQKPTTEVNFDASKEIGAVAENLNSMQAQQGDAIAQAAQVMAQAAQAISQAMQEFSGAVKLMAGPRQHVRGADGRITHTIPASVQ